MTSIKSEKTEVNNNFILPKKSEKELKNYFLMKLAPI